MAFDPSDPNSIPALFCNRHDDIRWAQLLALRCPPGISLETITPLSSVGATSLAVPAGATRALVSIETDGTEANTTSPVRFAIGTDPTAAAGIPLGNGGSYLVCGTEALAAFKLIATAAGPTITVQVQYFGYTP